MVYALIGKVVIMCWGGGRGGWSETIVADAQGLLAGCSAAQARNSKGVCTVSVVAPPCHDHIVKITALAPSVALSRSTKSDPRAVGGWSYAIAGEEEPAMMARRHLASGAVSTLRVQVRGVSDAGAKPTTFSVIRSLKEEDEEKEEEEESLSWRGSPLLERQWDGSRVAVQCT